MRDDVEAMAIFSTVKGLNICKPSLICCFKTQNKGFYHEIMPPKDADGIAYSEDPDQTAPLGLFT